MKGQEKFMINNGKHGSYAVLSETKPVKIRFKPGNEISVGHISVTREWVFENGPMRGVTTFGVKIMVVEMWMSKPFCQKRWLWKITVKSDQKILKQYIIME